MKNHDNDVKSGKAKEIFKVMKKEKKRKKKMLEEF